MNDTPADLFDKLSKLNSQKDIESYFIEIARKKNTKLIVYIVRHKLYHLAAEPRNFYIAAVDNNLDLSDFIYIHYDSKYMYFSNLHSRSKTRNIKRLNRAYSISDTIAKKSIISLAVSPDIAYVILQNYQENTFNEYDMVVFNVVKLNKKQFIDLIYKYIKRNDITKMSIQERIKELIARYVLQEIGAHEFSKFPKIKDITDIQLRELLSNVNQRGPVIFTFANCGIQNLKNKIAELRHGLQDSDDAPRITIHNKVKYIKKNCGNLSVFQGMIPVDPFLICFADHQMQFNLVYPGDPFGCYIYCHPRVRCRLYVMCMFAQLQKENLLCNDLIFMIADFIPNVP